jgi:hypothetical protein
LFGPARSESAPESDSGAGPERGDEARQPAFDPTQRPKLCPCYGDLNLIKFPVWPARDQPAPGRGRRYGVALAAAAGLGAMAGLGANVGAAVGATVGAGGAPHG